MSDQQVARPLPTYRETQTRNKPTHTHPCLDLTIPVKIVHASDFAAAGGGRITEPVVAEHNGIKYPLICVAEFGRSSLVCVCEAVATCCEALPM